MKILSSLIGLFLSVGLLFCALPNTTFAQNAATVDTSQVDSSSDERVVVDDWHREAALYHGWGWGLFGSGLGMAAIGFVLVGTSSYITDDKKGYDTAFVRLIGASIGCIGILTAIVGSGLLIADAVKFNDLREQERPAI